jgi:hypothetical protein
MSTVQNKKNINITEYSEKSFVVRGDIENITEELTNLGGKFNNRLRGGEGWIFSKSKQANVEKYKQNGLVISQDSFSNTNQTSYQNKGSSTISSPAQLARIEKQISNLTKMITVIYNSIVEDEFSEEEEDVAPRRRLL